MTICYMKIIFNFPKYDYFQYDYTVKTVEIRRHKCTQPRPHDLQFVLCFLNLIWKVFLQRYPKHLYRQLPHPFTNPFTGSVIDESTAQSFNLNISKLFFHKSRPFGSLPTKKRGRVKRKIRRKLVRAGGLID